MNGGRPGSVNYVDVAANGETRRGARVPTTDIEAGTILTIVTGGGGGYGKPPERPLEEVVGDVLDGYLKPEHAIEEYGVDLDRRTLSSSP